MAFNDDSPVLPDGNTIRRLRHEKGWAPRRLIEAIETAQETATGRFAGIAPNLLAGIEDRNERVPYDTVCWIASALDCEPIELVLDEPEEEDEDRA